MINLDRVIEGLVGVGLATSGVGGFMLVRSNEDRCSRTNIQIAGISMGVAGLLIASRSLMK
jgi:hypothetical protein